MSADVGIRKPLEGRAIVVTGGSTGIGLACAERLAADGAVVTIVSNDARTVEAALIELHALHLDVDTEVADVSEASQIGHAIERTARRRGRLDGLVNSAGIQTYGTVESTPEEVWDRTLQVNVKGMYLAARAVLPELRRRGGGVIVNVGSVQGTSAQRNAVAYAASKGAILSLTRAMAVDHAHEGIRVNSVSPGSVDTPMLRFAAAQAGATGPDEVDDVFADWGRGHPLGRIGRPADVAGAVAWLIGDDAEFVTGIDVRVDGGLLAQVPLRAPGR